MVQIQRWSELQYKCEQKAIATIKAMKERGLDFSIPTLSTLWKIDHQTEVSVWFDGQLERGFSAPRFTAGYSVCLESDNKLWLHLSKQSGLKLFALKGEVLDPIVSIKMLRRLSIEITQVKQFNAYKVGSQIKFWHWADRKWTTGTIIEIKTVDNYFMCLRIRYFKNNQNLEIEIFREDWLQND